jgi:hypothetical protein
VTLGELQREVGYDLLLGAELLGVGEHLHREVMERGTCIG